MNRRFWSQKRVFVTGHTGFKGSWLCAWLLEAGATVSGYALAAEASDALFLDAGLDRDMPSTLADIRDATALANAARASRPEIVFHLAAQPLVIESYERPLETFSVNVLGTACVLDAARGIEPPHAIVVVTSDKCYATGAPDRRHSEDDPLGGDDPYSASKAGAEYVAAGYRRSFFDGARVATARAGNVIGGGDRAKNRLLPDLLRAFERGVPAEIRNPDAVRPWQHVLDPLSAYVRLAESLAGGERRFASAWNFGPDARHEVAVGRLADMAALAWGSGAAWRRADGPALHDERAVLRLDSSKAARDLRWCGRLPLETAVAWTVAWQRDRSQGARARDLLRTDLERFESLAA